MRLPPKNQAYRGQVTRIVLEALRTLGKPMTAPGTGTARHGGAQSGHDRQARCESGGKTGISLPASLAQEEGGHIKTGAGEVSGMGVSEINRAAMRCHHA
jgi:hypothetical protein